jgi:preprotein translocase subunit SecA
MSKRVTKASRAHRYHLDREERSLDRHDGARRLAAADVERQEPPEGSGNNRPGRTPGAITLATNMAGRGVDIILGGNPPLPENRKRCVSSAACMSSVPSAMSRAGLIISCAAAPDAKAIGFFSFYVSTEDDLMRIFGGDRNEESDEDSERPGRHAIENKMISRSIESPRRKWKGTISISANT